MEIWRDIEGYEGKYQVSNLGRVRSLKDRWDNFRIKILKPQSIKKGYLYVQLCKDGITNRMLIHRLVADAFLPNPNNYPIVNHKDENTSNNVVSNLEWCDKSYNIFYGTALERMKAHKIGIPAWNKGKEWSDEQKQNLMKPHNMSVTHWKLVDGKRVWY